MKDSKLARRIAKRASALLPLIGLGLLILLIRSVDFEKAYQVVIAANLSLLALGLLLVPAEAIAKSTKLWVLTSGHHRCSFGASVRVYLTGMLFGALSPGKIGDFVKVYALSRESGISLLSSLAIVLVERMLEIACLGTLTAMGLVTLAIIEKVDPLIIASGVASLGIMLLLLLFLGPRVAAAALGPTYRFAVRRRLREGFESSFDAFREALSKTCRQPKGLTVATLLAAAAWGVVLVRSYAFAVALGVEVDFYLFILLLPIAIAVELLPISILGLGTREYAIAYLLAKFNVPLESALVLSLLGFVLVIVPIVLAGCTVVLSAGLSNRARRTVLSDDERALAGNEIHQEAVLRTPSE